MRLQFAPCMRCLSVVDGRACLAYLAIFWRASMKTDAMLLSRCAAMAVCFLIVEAGWDSKVQVIQVSRFCLSPVQCPGSDVRVSRLLPAPVISFMSSVCCKSQNKISSERSDDEWCWYTKGSRLSGDASVSCNRNMDCSTFTFTYANAITLPHTCSS